MLLAVAALAAVGLAIGGVLVKDRPLFFLAAWTFASLPWAYLLAATVRRTAGPVRVGSVAGVAALMLLFVASTVLVVTNCARRLGAGAELSGCDLSGEDLSGLDLSFAALVRADLREADLRGTLFLGSDVAGADLRGARIGRTSFGRASLEGADLRGLDLTHADLQGATLERARLDRADLGGTVLDGVSLAGASLRGANLADARLGGADLSNAALEGATLDGSYLAGATGIDDDALATALGVAADDLGGALIERDVRLEDQIEIRDAVAAACRGDGVEGTAPYPTGDFHPMVILDDSGAYGSETEQADERGWEPMAVRFAQLVACMQEEQQLPVESCPYQGQGSFGTINRVRNTRRFRVVEAATGRTVLERTLEGTLPRPCPPTHVFLESNPVETFAGSAITFDDIEPDLARLVG